MQSREEPLTKAEQLELRGYVSWAPVVVRAVLFLISLGIIFGLSRFALQLLGVPTILALVPTAAAGIVLYVSARRWTGGRELRNQIRQDLERGVARVHRIRVRNAIVFEEREDEGPIVFVQTDDDETFVFTGQDLARELTRGFPWREFEVRETEASRRFLKLQRLGESFPDAVVRPPLPVEQYRALELGKVRRWARVDRPFSQLIAIPHV